MKLTNLLNPIYEYKRRDRILLHLVARQATAIANLKVLAMVLAAQGLPMTAHDRRLAALKNRFVGMKCFVFGNVHRKGSMT